MDKEYNKKTFEKLLSMYKSDEYIRRRVNEYLDIILGVR